MQGARPAHGSSRRLKLLFLLPFAPDLRGSHGGSRACAEMLAMLALHHRVRALYLAAVGDPPPRQLPKGCESIEPIPITAPASKARGPFTRLIDTLARGAWGWPSWVEDSRSPAVAKRISEVAAHFQPDVVHCEYHLMAQYIPTVRSSAPGAKCIVTEQEPGIVAGARRGASLTLRQQIGAALRRRSWKRYERRALLAADAVVVFTQSDADAVGELLGRGQPPIAVIPLRLTSIDIPSSTAAQVDSDFLFVGNFMHPPNIDAARRLIDSIFPQILEKMPSATLTIVGPDPPAEIADAASGSIIVTGWVDEPRAYLAGARVVLIPLRQGGGMRVKMLEACASGKAIVASPTAIEGLDLLPDQHLVLAETDEEFARAALALIGDPARRAQLGESARDWSMRAQDRDAWAAEYAALYAVLDSAARPS